MKTFASILPVSLAAGAIAAGTLRAAEPATAPATQPSPVQRASSDAVARLYAQIAAETVGQVPVAQLVERVNGYEIMMNGLAKAEQIGGPRTVAEDFVQVQLQISGSRAAQLLLQAVAVKPEKSPIPPDRLARLLQDWGQRVFTSTGTNIELTRADVLRIESESASTAASVTKRIPDLKLDAAPAWAADPITATATAARDRSSLRTARTAETAARDELRRTIAALPLTADRKLGDAAMDDDAIRQVLDDAIEAATVYGVDYRADGSVEVRVHLDGQRLWQAILATR